MKAERAFDILKVHQKYYENNGSEIGTACRIGVKAVKKQIPQKVIFTDVGYDQYTDENLYACICPSCGLHIITYSDGDVQDSKGDTLEEMFHDCLVHHAYEGLNNYCNRCGQKLNWGNEKSKKDGDNE